MSAGTPAKTVNFGESLKVVDALRGEYEIGFELLTSDPGDYLKLSLEKGKMSVFVNGQWQPIANKEYSFQPNGQMPETLKVRVNSQAAFSIATVDPNAPTNPGATITLDSKLSEDLGDRSSRAWNAGKLDPTTGLQWNEGIVSAQPSAGISIREGIGGDDVSDWVKFSVTKTRTVQIQTGGAIVELVKKNAVVAGSDDGYSSNFTSQLTRGTYYLHFSSESSTLEAFTSAVTFVS